MQERANDTEYGLAAGVFTSNLNWATTISRGLKAGTIWVTPCKHSSVRVILLHSLMQSRPFDTTVAVATRSVCVLSADTAAYPDNIIDAGRKRGRPFVSSKA